MMHALHHPIGARVLYVGAVSATPAPKTAEALEGRSDDDLMSLAAAGARRAFEVLVRRHAGRLLGFCVKSTADRHRGEELAQELWLSVWTHRHDYRPEGRFVVWLFTLARNRLRNAARDGARRPVGEDLETASAAKDMSPSELDLLLARERRLRVERALDNVAPALREAVLLRFTEELAYDEVARILETNESTARSRVFHGLRELRRRLKGES